MTRVFSDNEKIAVTKIEHGQRIYWTIAKSDIFAALDDGWQHCQRMMWPERRISYGYDFSTRLIGSAGIDVGTFNNDFNNDFNI